MVKATLKTGRYQTEIEAGTHQLLVDEPLAAGGADLGPSPLDLLASSLAACVAITLRMYADRKGWGLTEVQVEVSLEDGFFRKYIRVAGPLDQSQLDRLKQIASSCPVSKILSQTNAIKSSIELIP